MDIITSYGCFLCLLIWTLKIIVDMIHLKPTPNIADAANMIHLNLTRVILQKTYVHIISSFFSILYFRFDSPKCATSRYSPLYTYWENDDSSDNNLTSAGSDI